MARLHRVPTLLCLAVGGTYAIEQGDLAQTSPRQLRGAQHSEHWSKLGGLAADEGDQLGEVAFLSYPAKCQAHCDAHVGCNSITFCPSWGGCFMKDGIFRGGEATLSRNDCETYYKTVELPSPRSGHWSQLDGLAVDEGDQLEDVSFFAYPVDCKAHCDAHAGCNSVTYCPAWGGCFLKDGIFTGREATSSRNDCLTYYKTQENPVVHWSKFGGLATDEGDQLEDVSFYANPTDCTKHCDAHAGCNSVTYCPAWGGCFLKDRVFRGGEAYKSASDCLTYFKIKAPLLQAHNAILEKQTQSCPNLSGRYEYHSSNHIGTYDWTQDGCVARSFGSRYTMQVNANQKVTLTLDSKEVNAGRVYGQRGNYTIVWRNGLVTYKQIQESDCKVVAGTYEAYESDGKKLGDAFQIEQQGCMVRRFYSSDYWTPFIVFANDTVLSGEDPGHIQGQEGSYKLLWSNGLTYQQVAATSALLLP